MVVHDVVLNNHNYENEILKFFTTYRYWNTKSANTENLYCSWNWSVSKYLIQSSENRLYSIKLLKYAEKHTWSWVMYYFCIMVWLCMMEEGGGTLAYHLLMGGQNVSPGLAVAEEAGRSVTILRCRSKCSLLPKF